MFVPIHKLTRPAISFSRLSHFLLCWWGVGARQISAFAWLLMIAVELYTSQHLDAGRRPMISSTYK